MNYELDLPLGGAVVERIRIGHPLDFFFSNGAWLGTEAPLYLDLEDVFMATVEDLEAESLQPVLHLLHLEVQTAKVIRDGSIDFNFIDGTKFRVSPNEWDAWHFHSPEQQLRLECGPDGWDDRDWERIHPEPFHFRWPFRRWRSSDPEPEQQE